MTNISIWQIKNLLASQGVAAQLLNCTQAKAKQVIVAAVSTDSRTIQAGELFIALVGDNFDGHAFMAQIEEMSAAAALVSEVASEWCLPLLKVADTAQALTALATAWRQHYTIPLIAVTGSNGKTTVTQMLATIMHHALGSAYLATKGNFNNAIGVPLTILQLSSAARMAVVELGMNHVGEIIDLAKVAQPTIALVNNAQREHQEFLHSVAATAHENASVFQAVQKNGYAVYPSDDECSAIFQQAARHLQQKTFALAPAVADVVGSASWVKNSWQIKVKTATAEYGYQLNLPGWHNVRNSLAAFSCALVAGLDGVVISQALQQFAPVKGRSAIWQRSYQGRLLYIVDDSYNANPDSVLAALQMLKQLPAPHLMVLGDMAEVGVKSEQYHSEIGLVAEQQGIKLWTIGAASQAAGGYHFDSMAELQQQTIADLKQFSSIVVKGSRFMQMEQLVKVLLEQTGELAELKKGASHVS